MLEVGWSVSGLRRGAQREQLTKGPGKERRQRLDVLSCGVSVDAGTGRQLTSFILDGLQDQLKAIKILERVSVLAAMGIWRWQNVHQYGLRRGKRTMTARRDTPVTDKTTILNHLRWNTRGVAARHGGLGVCGTTLPLCLQGMACSAAAQTVTVLPFKELTTNALGVDPVCYISNVFEQP